MVNDDMTAQLIDSSGIYRVRGDVKGRTKYGFKWYTAKPLPHLPGGYLITNHRGSEVDPFGPTGQRVLAAIEREGG